MQHSFNREIFKPFSSPLFTSQTLSLIWKRTSAFSYFVVSIQKNTSQGPSFMHGWHFSIRMDQEHQRLHLSSHLFNEMPVCQGQNVQREWWIEGRRSRENLPLNICTCKQMCNAAKKHRAINKEMLNLKYQRATPMKTVFLCHWFFILLFVFYVGGHQLKMMKKENAVVC